MSEKPTLEEIHRHEAFERGRDSLKQTDFESSLLRKEKADRQAVRIKQTLGSQGPDGGCIVRMNMGSY